MSVISKDQFGSKAPSLELLEVMGKTASKFVCG